MEMEPNTVPARSSVLGALLFVVFLPGFLDAQSQILPADHAAVNLHLEIGPVAGLTTTWHPAPIRTAVPLGASLSFRVRFASSAPVRWTGVTEVTRSTSFSTARVELHEPGLHPVAVELETVSGETVTESVELDVVEIDPGAIRFGEVRLSVDPLVIDPARPAESSLQYFFRDDPIATLKEVGEKRYRTSVNRWLNLEVDVEPSGFEPLVEWRHNGAQLRYLGSAVRWRVYPVGVHQMTAGPSGSAAEVALETYRVKIVAPPGGIPDGQPVTFQAVTDPPGFEDEVTWLAATKMGTTNPVTGEGREFTTRFDNTFVLVDPGTGERGQWIGVRADNATLGQDSRRAALPFELAHLKLDTGGWVSVEFTGSCADFRHRLRLVGPAMELFTSATTPGTVIVLGEFSTADSLEFELAVDSPAGAYTLKSGENLKVRRLDPGSSSGLDRMWVLAWEDTPGLGDQDFNDFLAVVRVSKTREAVDPKGFNARSIFGAAEISQGVISDDSGTPYPFVAGKNTLVRLHLNTPCPPCSVVSLAGQELRLYQRKGQNLVGGGFTTTGTSVFLPAEIRRDPRETETIDFRIAGTELARAEETIRPGFIQKIQYVAEAQVFRNTLDGPEPIPAACLRAPLPVLTVTRPWTVLVVPVGKDEASAKALLTEDLPVPLTEIFADYVAANPFPTPSTSSSEPWVIIHPTKVHVPPSLCFAVFGTTTLDCSIDGLTDILESWNEDDSADRCPAPDTCKPKAAAIVGLLPDRLWTGGESPGSTLPLNRLPSCPPVPSGRRFEPLFSGVVLDTKSDPLSRETSYTFTHEVGHIRGLVPHDRGDGDAHTFNSESGPWGWSAVTGITTAKAGSVMGGKSKSRSDIFFELPDYRCLLDQIDDPLPFPVPEP
jgi:hypothetical protein